MKTALITGACINTGVAIVEKFASEGYNIVFTGRNKEKVHLAEKEYKEKFPNVKITGYHIDSLLDERTVDEKSVEELFKSLDEQNIFIETLVLNAADQGLGITVFENPLTDFMRVINTNMVKEFADSRELTAYLIQVETNESNIPWHKFDLEITDADNHYGAATIYKNEVNR